MAHVPGMKSSPKQEEALIEDVMAYADDPLAFVSFIFPWGEPGPLERYQGPRKWQERELSNITRHISINRDRMARGETPLMYRLAMNSGRGIGKSALLMWLLYWFLSTRWGATVVVTANNETQLKTKTWAELGRWHTMAQNSHWFERQALSLIPAPWFKQNVDRQLKIGAGYYCTPAQPWHEARPGGFAGAHNPLGMMYIFDEAAEIPSAIWSTTAGVFTEPEPDRYHIVASNPRRNTGDFFECFHKGRDQWRTVKIDARTVEGTDPAIYQDIIAKYGAESDEARINVYGEFPKTGDKQFISRDLVEGAVARELPQPMDTSAPLILGVDVARYGDDRTVLRWRQGRDARSIPAVRVRGKNVVEVADLVAEWIDRTKPDAVNVDGAGAGAGVVDILKSRGYKVNEINFGSKPNDDTWYNKGTEMWADLRTWLETGCLPNDQELVDDLVNREYYYPGTDGKINLETKDDLKKRGFASPDDADGIALTFAVRVSRKDQPTSRARNCGRVAPGTDYNPFARRQ